MSNKIYIVEDDFLLSLVMKKHLTLEGYECHCFANGHDFIAFFKKNQEAKALILDVKLKGDFSGIDVFKELQEFSKTPIIFSTGNSDIANKAETHVHQVKGILIKPIVLEDLSKLINENC